MWLQACNLSCCHGIKPFETFVAGCSSGFVLEPSEACGDVSIWIESDVLTGFKQSCPPPDSGDAMPLRVGLVSRSVAEGDTQ